MAKNIMIQGTMSGAGKSLICAAICRMLKNDGYKVAPFKSQNMALNSFITDDGLEMGRAQVTQAYAAGLTPSVYMNPILLKPNSDVGSQVIVNGEVIGNMSAREYYARKKEFVPYILKAYEALAAENDVIVIEGAGSPAEINLRDNDIVNMGLAELLDAPVYLVGDIDRGGVFAQLLGTVEWLTPKERKRVQGFIINKFRGDVSLLDSGIKMLEERCGIPVLGVVPYTNADIEDEDSLTERFKKSTAQGLIDIAVVKLPHISNFTDFDVFEGIDTVSLRYVKALSELKNPDMIILPGTKNTIGDLLWLKESGLAAAICKYAASGGIVFGICGGYQMLGEYVTDELGVEHKGQAQGLSLLPVETRMTDKKRRCQVKGSFANVSGILAPLNGMKLTGYEIHMGVSAITEKGSFLAAENMTKIKSSQDTAEIMEGACKGNVYGSYVHGIFDEPEIAAKIAEIILTKKGIDTEINRNFDIKSYRDKQYDMIADALKNAGSIHSELIKLIS